MAIRLDLVDSATQFLLDPSVAESSLESRLAFLRSKNMTGAEIDAALARAAPPNPPPTAWPALPPGPPHAPRDWRDWFVTATVLAGAGYSLYAVLKHWVYPAIAPPAVAQLEADKAALVEQLAGVHAQVAAVSADTAELRAAEVARAKRFNDELGDFSSTVKDLSTAADRRDAESTRLRDDINALRDMLPPAMDAYRATVDARLRQLATELASLKVLLAQRFGPAGSATHAAGAAAAAASPSPATTIPTLADPGPKNSPADPGPRTSYSDLHRDPAGPGRASFAPPSASSHPHVDSILDAIMTPGQASIPAWQMAVAKKPAVPASASSPIDGDFGKT